MTAAPSMPLFCGDYIADTTRLTMEQSGAYLQILMVTWRQNCRPLPDDDGELARVCRMTPGRFRDRIRPKIEQFFDLSGGFWRNHRLEKEWVYVAKRAEVSRRNGAAGGRPSTPPPHSGSKPNSNGANFHAETEQGFGAESDSVCRDKPLNCNETANPAGSFQGGPEETRSETTQPQPHKDKEDDDAGARAHVVASRVASMAGFTGAIRLSDLAVAALWLKEGADPDVDIFPVVADVLNRAAGRRISSFAYFSGAISTHCQERLAPEGDGSNVERIRKRKPDAGDRNAAILGPLYRAYERRKLDGGPARSG